MSEFAQILDTVNLGIVILDRELIVRYWNGWMAFHSGIPAERIIGAPLFDFFPTLNSPKFLRSCKAVLAFGSFAFFSQKLHGFLFPFKPESSFGSRFDRMQQSCSMGPLRDATNAVTSLYLTVQDVTELADYESRLLEMNMRDGLTGAYNRRYLEQRLNEELERCFRYARKSSIIMLDIDFFKKVNDGYGHQCGDFILKAVSAKIASMIRKTDFLARYGGEEFCCVLPETGITDALGLAERLRKAVEEMKTVYRETEVRVTISLGVAETSEEVSSAESLLGKADEALYTAKKSGRNRVVASSRTDCLSSSN
jgi:diguanylate cyclase (GGDEF)-like protein